MIKAETRSRTARVAVLGAVLLLLAGCGGSEGSTGTGLSATAAPGTDGRGGGFGGADFTAIQDCLKAAGVSLPTPSGGQGGVGGQRGVGGPEDSGARPSGAPNGPPPSGGVRPSGAPRGGGGMFQSAEVQAALKACGIELPTGRGGPGPSATSTG
jgi:hypothetical protein